MKHFNRTQYFSTQVIFLCREPSCEEKNIGAEKTKETLYSEPASPFAENEDDFAREENLRVLDYSDNALTMTPLQSLTPICKPSKSYEGAVDIAVNATESPPKIEKGDRWSDFEVEEVNDSEDDHHAAAGGSFDEEEEDTYNYNTSLASLHTYLDEVDDTTHSHRLSFLDSESTLFIPLFYTQGSDRGQAVLGLGLGVSIHAMVSLALQAAFVKAKQIFNPANGFLGEIWPYRSRPSLFEDDAWYNHSPDHQN
ncbi:hypothetical protein ACFE04_020837 [Oxalis oulophora]